MTSVTPDAPELTVSVDRQPGSRVQLTVEAPPSDVEAAVTTALKRLATRVRVPGFRPGKAPTAVVERTLGWDAVRREATDLILPQLYRRALDQAGIEPVDDPEGDVPDLERGAPLRFTVSVTVRPETDLGDYLSLRVEERSVEITEQQVDDIVEEVRRRHSELVPVEGRPCQAGDVLRATLVMRRGDEIIGGADEGERDVELDRTRVLPGIVDGLVGVEAGTQHTFATVLPADYPNEALRGAEVTIDATVHAIRERRLPPLDDSLAALDGNGTTLEELRDHYRTLLEETARTEEERRYEGEVLEALRELAVVDVPEVMIERELDRQVRDMELQLAQAGLQLERYLEYTGETMEKIRGERRESAVQRVKLELSLQALAAAEGLEVDEADVTREEERLATGQRLTPEQRDRLHRATHRDLLLRGAAQRAMEIARGEV